MKTTKNMSQDQVRAALDNVTTQLARVTIELNNLKAILLPDDSSTDKFEANDSANKGDDGKLTARGIEICYRLFDRGENRNQVASKMRISFTAATHRYHAWQKLGGPEREKQSLE